MISLRIDPVVVLEPLPMVAPIRWTDAGGGSSRGALNPAPSERRAPFPPFLALTTGLAPLDWTLCISGHVNTLPKWSVLNKADDPLSGVYGNLSAHADELQVGVSSLKKRVGVLRGHNPGARRFIPFGMGAHLASDAQQLSIPGEADNGHRRKLAHRPRYENPR